MGIWDMLSTTPKDKMRKRSERSVTPKPLFGDEEPSSAAVVAAELSPKLEVPITPSGLSKRKNPDGANGDEGSKRLRSGTIVTKTKASDRASDDIPHSLSQSQRSPANRLSMSTTMRPASIFRYSVSDELDNVAIEKAQNHRFAADQAEVKARNDLNLARVALNDRMMQKEDADGALTSKDEEIASLLQQVEDARRERDQLYERVVHVGNHLSEAEIKVDECTRVVSAKTTAAKQAQREYATLVRGDS